MSIFEIQLSGKDEYAEHYEHGTDPRLVQQKRSRYSKEWNLAASADLALALALYGFFFKFELLCRSWRPGPESPVSKSCWLRSQNLLWEVPLLISAAHKECWQLCLLCHSLGSAVSHGAVFEAERTWKRNFLTCMYQERHQQRCSSHHVYDLF